MKNTLTIFIFLIAGFAVYGSFGLAIQEWNQSNICPKILGIPACYIVLTCFTIAFISQVLSAKKWIYFLSIGIVTLIATTGTLGELTGIAKCPKTDGGTPMCFISLGICISLLLLKLILLKLFQKH